MGHGWICSGLQPFWLVLSSQGFEIDGELEVKGFFVFEIGDFGIFQRFWDSGSFFILGGGR